MRPADQRETYQREKDQLAILLKQKTYIDILLGIVY
jgi:hypothetical protein